VEDKRDLKEFLMYLFKGVDALLELNVVGWEFGLGSMASTARHRVIRGRKI